MVLHRPDRAVLARLSSAQKDYLILSLFDRLETLERRLCLDSSNSGKPPSSNGYKKPPSRVRNLRGKSGKKSGGQKGHKGETLEQTAHPDKVVNHAPERCPSCSRSLAGTLWESYEARQVFDIPPPQVVVTEHRALVKQCVCGCQTKGTFPDNVKISAAQYGPRITAAAVYLSAAQFIPEDRLRETLSGLFGLSPSTGTLAAMNRQAAAELASVMEKIRRTVACARVKHLDETGFRIGGKTCWMHVASTESLTHYRAEEKRGSLPEGLCGTAVHDHWKPYYKLENVIHALCNAHHLRELKALIDIEKEGWARDMERLLRFLARLVRKAAEKETGIPPPVVERAAGLYERIIAKGLLFHEKQPPLGPANKKGRRKRRIGHNLLIRLRDFKDDTLRFLTDPHVPFSNNLAERDLRMIKLRQKISGGFRTMNGAKTFAILRGFLSSARKQNINLLTALQNPELMAIAGE
ncbi:MAG: IS66 family transposase [bacterium]|nr:IS66 family transposase [bacterium]